MNNKQLITTHNSVHITIFLVREAQANVIWQLFFKEGLLNEEFREVRDSRRDNSSTPKVTAAI